MNTFVNSEIELKYALKKSDYNYVPHKTLHSNSYLEIYYILSNSCSIRIGSYDEIELNSNEILIVNPYIWKSNFFSQLKNTEYIKIGISGLKFSNGTDSNYYVLENDSNVAQLKQLINTILKESKSQEVNHEKIVEHNLQLLFLNLTRVNFLRFVGVDFTTTKQDNITEIKEYITDNASSNITLDTISEIFFMSKYYISTLFKQYFGISPIDYLINVRIDNAIHLLINSSLPISNIATQTGFASLPYFSKIFKDRTDFAPTHFRKEYRCID